MEQLRVFNMGDNQGIKDVTVTILACNTPAGLLFPTNHIYYDMNYEVHTV